MKLMFSLDVRRIIYNEETACRVSEVWPTLEATCTLNQVQPIIKTVGKPGESSWLTGAYWYS